MGQNKPKAKTNKCKTKYVPTYAHKNALAHYFRMSLVHCACIYILHRYIPSYITKLISLMQIYIRNEILILK